MSFKALKKSAKVVRTLADCLWAIGDPTRLEITKYCQKPQRFIDIVQDLRLNPASFKFHSRILLECDIIRKPERGVYQSTELGNLLLQLVNRANELI